MFKNAIKMSKPIVQIISGKLQGKLSESSKKIPFYSFLGIPYAQPPIGYLRFKAPQPAPAWSDVRDATKEGQDCYHKVPIVDQIQGSEDCLYLNVYTHDLPQEQNKKKPVMVWIHGGGFTSGSGSPLVYGPDFLLNEDIVLVTINYRLGILGFLSLEDSSLGVPGNAGLKDMVLALKWVQENIEQFNGNSNNVTIFGESAGGAAVHYLMLSPLARGLFHRAILQSGCAINSWASGRRCAGDLAKLLNLETTNEKKILETLQKLPIEELYKVVEKVPDPFIANFLRPFGPVIEREHTGAFLCESPIELIKSGRYNKVPMMLGYTNREGMISETFQKPKAFRPHSNFELTIPWFLRVEAGSAQSQLIASKIKKFYYGNEKPSRQNKDKFYLLEGDNFFIRELLKVAKLHQTTMDHKVFLYRISIESSLNMMKNLAVITEPGVSHADDLGYLFKNPFTPEIQPSSREEIAVDRFVKMWTNFAKFGDPNSSDLNPNWEPLSQQLNFLDIGDNLQKGVDPESDRMNFWREIFTVNPQCKL